MREKRPGYEKSTKILIVEDEFIIAADIEEKLRKAGFTVVGISYSGEDAIEKVKKKKPDLVLMDIQLSGDMDGIEAANEITHKYKIPVIYLTSHTDSLTFSKAMKAEPDNYLIKPFDENELKSAIEISLFQNNLKEE